MDRPRLRRVTCTEGRRVARRPGRVKPAATGRSGLCSGRADRRLLVHGSEVAQAHRPAGRGPPAAGADALRAARGSLYERVEPAALRAAGGEARRPDARAGARGMAARGPRARRGDAPAFPGRLARGVVPDLDRAADPARDFYLELDPDPDPDLDPDLDPDPDLDLDPEAAPR